MTDVFAHHYQLSSVNCMVKLYLSEIELIKRDASYTSANYGDWDRDRRKFLKESWQSLREAEKMSADLEPGRLSKQLEEHLADTAEALMEIERFDPRPYLAAYRRRKLWKDVACTVVNILGFSMILIYAGSAVSAFLKMSSQGR